MNSKHPIPNVIVVGILRVLLSTCPNTKKNKSQGVQIHREWASCIKLYLTNDEIFKDYEPLFNCNTAREKFAE